MQRLIRRSLLNIIQSTRQTQKQQTTTQTRESVSFKVSPSEDRSLIIPIKTYVDMNLAQVLRSNQVPLEFQCGFSCECATCAIQFESDELSTIILDSQPMEYQESITLVSEGKDKTQQKDQFEKQKEDKQKKYIELKKRNKDKQSKEQQIMSQSYAKNHQKKLQFVNNQFSSVGGNNRQRLSSEERTHLLSDKDAYIDYLENQLDKISEHSLIEHPIMQKRVQELEQTIIDHEDKFANVTKLIKLLQTFAENQEDENKLIKQHFNKPLNSIGKKMENFQQDIVSELKEQIIKIEQKESERDTQIFEALSLFQKNINNFEDKIESFANKLSHDMASDIKTLSSQINQTELQSNNNNNNLANCYDSIKQNNNNNVDDSYLKANLDKFREEINRKIEFVLKEMRKNALISDVENVESKIKKEQKERTYLCKFVDDLTRKIDELPTSLTTRASTSRNVSPSLQQESNQFKLIKQIESDIEDLKEVVNALVDKIESQNKKKKDQSFVTVEQFENLEKVLSSQINRVVDRYSGAIQNIPYDESLRESDNKRNPNNTISSRYNQFLKSDQYLTQQLRSPQFEQQNQHQQQWQQDQQIDGNIVNQSGLIHPEDDSYLIQQKYNQIIQDDQDLRETLNNNNNNNNRNNQQQNISGVYDSHSQANGENNLGESFGLNQTGNISNNLSHKNNFINKDQQSLSLKKYKQDDHLDQYPQKEKRSASNSKQLIKQSDAKENKSNSNSLNRGRKNPIDQSTDTLKKNHKKEQKSQSRSQSKSPSQQNNKNEVSSSVKSINLPKKVSNTNISIESRYKSNSRNTLTEPDESRFIKSPITSNNKLHKNSFDSESQNILRSRNKIKSPSPVPVNSSQINQFAEKKRMNGEKIKELFKKKKQIDSTNSSHHNINQSISQQQQQQQQQKSSHTSLTKDKSKVTEKKKKK